MFSFILRIIWAHLYRIQNWHWHAKKKKMLNITNHNHINRTLGTSARWIMFFLPKMLPELFLNIKMEQSVEKGNWNNVPAVDYNMIFALLVKNK